MRRSRVFVLRTFQNIETSWNGLQELVTSHEKETEEL